MECRDLSQKISRKSAGIRKAIEVLRPHWQEICKQYEDDIREYELYSRKDSAVFGRIIKCHLISEIYLERYLIRKLSVPNLSDARLSYHQKAMLLPERNAAPALFKPGLLTLNKLRNKFAHKLDSTLSKHELSTMTAMLIMSERPASTMNAIEMVEKFTVLSCACLNPTPSHIEELFANAMQYVADEFNQDGKLD